MIDKITHKETHDQFWYRFKYKQHVYIEGYSSFDAQRDVL
jgi:hypothetical protein